MTCGRDNDNGTHHALELTGHLSHPFVPAPTPAERVLAEVAAERTRQDAKWGEQNHPDGTGAVWELCSGQHAGWAEEAADDARRRCQEASERTWGDTYALILNEEVAEAFAEEDPGKLRAELLQVAAVAVAWVEKLDREAEAILAPRPSASDDSRDPRPCPRCGQICTYDGWDLTHPNGIGIGSCAGDRPSASEAPRTSDSEDSAEGVTVVAATADGGERWTEYGAQAADGSVRWVYSEQGLARMRADLGGGSVVGRTVRADPWLPVDGEQGGER